jgi:hypothetical protein
MRMPHRRALVVGPLLLAICGLSAFIFANASPVKSSGAYFSESHQGTITGTLAGVHCTPTGGGGAEHLDIAFPNPMEPGVAQTVSSTCTNDGNIKEDIYVVFDNPTALSALNNLGTFGEVHLQANGTEIFASQNLNDHPSCPPGSTSVAHPIPCAALGSVYLIASNVAVGNAATMGFSFNYAAKLGGSGSPATGLPSVWNTYPDPAGGQNTTNPTDGTGNGLPYKFVAIQAGAPAPTS